MSFRFSLPTAAPERAVCTMARPAAVLLLGVCLALFVLAGCAPKKLSADDLPLETASDDGRDSIHLPADDGKPLSPDELDALISVGDFDRNVRGEDMREVILHFKFYVHQARRTVERNVERGEIFLPHIRSVLRQKRLPGELAYLPFIESGYNVMAKSRTGALGMWQFVKGTGKYYGMKRDWWSDERYDPYQSTDAAAEYLGKLNGMFNDWHLAITAYNAGEGRVSRAMSAAGARNYFDLRKRNDSVPEKDRLTDENQQYLPRFLAVCKIMRNLESLGFRAPDSGKARDVTEVTVRPGTDLMAMAKGLGMSWNEFSSYNPTFLRYISPPGRNSSVYVPRGMGEQAKSLARRTDGGGGWRTYTVRKGDTMARIATRSGVPLAELRRVNQVSEPLKAGKVIRIPGSEGSAATASLPEPTSERDVRSGQGAGNFGPSGRVHTVVSGDSVYGLARSWDVPANAILDVNNLSSSSLRVGQKLQIPGQQAAPKVTQTASTKSKPTSSGASASSGTKSPEAAKPASQKGTQAPAKSGQTSSQSSGQTSGKTSGQTSGKTSGKSGSKSITYTVKPGDTVWAIARKFDIAPTELLRANNMTRDSRLRPGDAMRVVLN